MYIIRPPPMSTRLAKESARAVVASEQVSAIRASTTMCFMVVRLSPSIHLLGDLELEFHLPRQHYSGPAWQLSGFRRSIEHRIWRYIPSCLRRLPRRVAVGL